MSKFAKNNNKVKRHSLTVKVAQIRQPAVVTSSHEVVRKASETANKRNFAGGKSFTMSDAMEFVTLCAAQLLHTGRKGGRSYETEDARIARLRALIPKVGAQFAAKVALWLRISCGSRSMSHLIAALIAPFCSGEPWAESFYNQVVVRPDDMCEIAAGIWKFNGQPRKLQDVPGKVKKKLPNAVKRGFARAFGKFDPYRLAKYANKSEDPRLRDLVMLVHPTPTEKNGNAIEGLLTKTLVNTDTWEAELSAAGQQGKDKGQVWKELVEQGKLGQLALLKNLRNIADNCSRATLLLALDQLRDESAIRKNGILPAQYVTAYEAIAGSAYSELIKSAIDEAVEIAAGNVPKIGDKVLIAIDESRSMGPYERDQAALFAATLLKANPNADVVIFADTIRHEVFDRKQSLLPLRTEILSRFKTGGTNFNLIFEAANKPYDTVAILSDQEGWMGGTGRNGAPTKSLQEYQLRHNVVPTIFSFDLGGDGSLMFREDSIITLAGCSFQVFKLLNILKNDRKLLVDLIDQIEIGRRLPAFDDETGAE